MTEALRPMSVGELLDRTFFLYRKHFVLFVALIALPHAVLLAVQLFSVVLRAGGPRFSLTAILMGLVTMVVYLAVVAVSQGATVIAVSRMHLGAAPGISEAFAGISGRIPTLALIMIAAGLGAGLGLILLIVPGILLALMWSLSIPIAVLEHLNVRDAMSRSSVLTKGHRGRIFVIYVLFFIVTYIFYSLWQLPMLFAAGLFVGRGPATLPVWTQIALPVGQFITQCLVAPLLTIAMALVYYDERVRKEAFDLEHMMSELDRPTPA